VHTKYLTLQNYSYNYYINRNWLWLSNDYIGYINDWMTVVLPLYKFTRVYTLYACFEFVNGVNVYKWYLRPIFYFYLLVDRDFQHSGSNSDWQVSWPGSSFSLFLIDKSFGLVHALACFWLTDQLTWFMPGFWLAVQLTWFMPSIKRCFRSFYCWPLSGMLVAASIWTNKNPNNTFVIRIFVCRLLHRYKCYLWIDCH